MHLSQFSFSYAQFYKQAGGGGLKLRNFQVACAQEFQTNNDFFCAVSKYGMLLLICENFEKNYTW